jgi:sulfide dehydrogenase cytochrome subunit
MKNFKSGLIPGFAIALALPLVFACNKNISEVTDPAAKESKEVSQLAATVDLPGRTLAANCFQCHGTNGHAGELKIAGIDRSELVRKFNEFKAESPRNNIMNLHAYAYTTEEIQLMGDFFSKQ